MPSFASAKTRGVVALRFQYRRLAWLASLLLLSGCFGGGRSAEGMPLVPVTPGDQARCQIAQGQDNPLVTEWPGSEKANLEARLSEGAVVVAYSGCALRLLPACRVPGSYSWRRTTSATDVIEIRNADDLYAKLPLGAVSLEGELQQRGRLAVQTTVSGQMQLGGFDANLLLKDSACQGATHVLSALSIGAFKLRAGGEMSGKANVDVQGIGSGQGSTERAESVLREAGVPSRCDAATAEAPDAACASPIQLFLRPLPSTVVDRGPPGTVKVRFWPVRPAETWEVVVGDRPFCTTPCERWVDPAMPYSLKHDPGFFQRNQFVELPDLRQHAALERMDVRVIPRHTGEFVVGIVATSLGGVGVATGIALTAVGCGDGGGMCTAGLITLPAGALIAGPGIWMILDSAGEIKVTPAGDAAITAPPR